MTINKSWRLKTVAITSKGQLKNCFHIFFKNHDPKRYTIMAIQIYFKHYSIITLGNTVRDYLNELSIIIPNKMVACR